MRGDVTDIGNRLRALLPSGWFASVAPNLEAVLTCLATPWAWIYDCIQFAIDQSRLSTATGSWLDLAALDFFGTSLQRLDGESDTAFWSRMSWTLFRGAATRSAVSTILAHVTGSQPSIFEPQNSADTGAYGASGLGSLCGYQGVAYGTKGGWGSLSLPLQFFVTVHRPVVTGVASLAGYGIGVGGFGEGQLSFIDLTTLPGAVTDQVIANTLSAVLPVGAVAWLRIS